MEENKYLKAARVAREENNVEDAKRYYEMVKVDDPENAEAKFFYEIYRLWDGKKGEWYNNFMSLCQVAPTAIRMLAESDMSDEEKAKLLDEMFDEAEGLPLKLNRILNELNHEGSEASRIRNGGREGMKMLYGFGDTVEKYFSNNEAAMQVAVKAWKAGVYRQQQWYGMGLDKTLPASYTTKIQKFDSTYTMPKKAGCIQFGSK